MEKLVDKIAEEIFEDKVNDLENSFNVVMTDLNEVDLLQSEEWKNRDPEDYFVNKDQAIEEIKEALEEGLKTGVSEAYVEDLGGTIEFKEELAEYKAEFDKGVEEYVEKLNSIEANENYLSEAYYVENKDFESAEHSGKEIQDLKEDLKALEEKFGSEIVEKAQEQLEANQFVKSADISIGRGDETLKEAFAADRYNDSNPEEKAEQILEKFDSRAEQFSDESLANAFNEKLGTDFTAEQVKELKEEIEVAEALSKDAATELSL